jgi:sulfate adenylyltransferase subunit 2
MEELPRADSTAFSPDLLQLEAEAIGIIRKAIFHFSRPVLLFSGGKDSMVMLHLAHLAFGKLPCPIMHVDTGHNFPEVLAFRDQVVTDYNADLIVAAVEDSVTAGRAIDPGDGESRNRIQSITLMDAIKERGFDCVFGGGRRDEQAQRTAPDRRYGRSPKTPRACTWYGALVLHESFV